MFCGINCGRVKHRHCRKSFMFQDLYTGENGELYRMQVDMKLLIIEPTRYTNFTNLFLE